MVKRRAGEGWNTCYIAYDCKKDGEYGYGGHVFQGGRGAVSEIATLDRGDLSTSASRLELWYAAWPRGGRASLQVDGAAPVVLETRADALEDRWHEIDLDAGPHKVTLRGEGQGTLRAYGLVLEEDGPGVVWDTMSMIGAFTRRLFLFSPNHIARQVAHRDPHLIVFNYGGNDLRRFVSRGVSPERFKEEMRVAYQKIRAGKPEASCLVVSVIDHGRSGIRTVEARHVDAVVDAQREVAFELGCGFFNSLEAMGGPRSIYKWRAARPTLASPDLKHLSERGRDLMGGMIYEALVAGYVAHRRAAASPPA